jgi:hypothetical protein
MRVHTYKYEIGRAINSNTAKLLRSIGNRPKLISYRMRKIETLRFQPKQPAWSYSDFAARLMEILVILHHRNIVKAASASQRKINIVHFPLSDRNPVDLD